ncbi:MAG: arylsulfatase [Fuerstiella sp.]
MNNLLTFVLAAIVATGLVQAEEPINTSRPNVILIMTDDQGYGDLSCHGHPWLRTPNLDELHAESVRLTDYHVSPLCGPTRATLMTGRHCRNVGFRTNQVPGHLISRETPTIANAFAANGYRTGIFGKWHLGDFYPHRAIDRGFQEAVVHGGGAITTVGDVWGNDYFDDRYFHNGKKTQYKGFCTDVFFEEATRFIMQSTKSGKPFFCYLPTNIPHGPHYAHEDYAKMFEGKPHPRLFAALVHFDTCMGEMRDMLKENGLAENTIFIYCTDNGSPRSYAGGIYNAGMQGGKGSSYEGGHRVPCFIHWPAGKLTGGRDVNQLSAHLDILPTLVDLCKLQTPKNYQTDGLSLKSVLDGTANDLGDRVVVESYNGVVMTKRWRLMHHRKSKKDPEIDSKLLYDMSVDPAQKKDVAGAHPEVVSRLNAVLEEVNAKNDTRQQRYIIGSDKHNPVEFSPASWSKRISVWQSGMRKGASGAVPIFAEVETTGTYRFSLRRWPHEMDEPIRSAPELTVPEGFEGETKKEKGEALPIIKARLKVAGFEKTVEVTDDMTEATFTVPLKKGDCDIHATFIADDGKEYGAYFLYVKRNEEYGTLIFEDHFERKESQEEKDEPGNGWTTSSDNNKSAQGSKNVDLCDGTLHIATHQGAHHGISVRHGFAFTDGTISVRVKLHDEDDRLRLNFADLPPEEVGVSHLRARHLFDAIITLNRISFEDKTGGVLKFAEARNSGTLTSEQKKILATKYKAYPVKLEPDKWHTFAVHVDGDRISAHLDNRYIGDLRSEGFAHPTKTLMRMLVRSTVTIDDFMVWRRK